MIQRCISSLRQSCSPLSKLSSKSASALPHSGKYFWINNNNNDSRSNNITTSDQLNLSIGIRSFHSSISRKDNSLIIGGAGLLVASVIAQQAFKYYQTKSDITKAAPTTDNATESSKSNTAATDNTTSSSSTTNASSSANASSTPGTPPKPGFFASFFARNFYEGGFEPKMTRREAALVLGVRESSPVERIKDAHRRILLLNHPDRGGSAFIAAKVNEAKDLLMKGKDGK